MEGSRPDLAVGHNMGEVEGYGCATTVDLRRGIWYFPGSCVMKSALNQHVLVLNRLWQAVNVCTARRALTLLFQGHAQVVLNNPDGSFRTFNFDEWRDVSASGPGD